MARGVWVVQNGRGTILDVCSNVAKAQEAIRPYLPKGWHTEWDRQDGEPWGPGTGRASDQGTYRDRDDEIVGWLRRFEV